jgi:hypothetical protein
MTGQATFSPEDDDEEEDEDDLAGVLTVSADFFAAGLSADAPPFELDSLDVEEEEEPESLDALSLVPASAATEPFFLLSVR